ncbi:unnamed protein product [Oreochromis niloticus]|nr:unnamed protein product [Mustela putorius furo]
MELRMLWTIVFFITFFTASVSGERVEVRPPIVYSRDQLLALGASAALPTAEQANIPREVRRKRRGTRAGIGRRSKFRRYRPAIPSIIMGNVRSLPNKVDELAALTRHQRSYRECSLMCFTESWLTALTLDSHHPQALFLISGDFNHISLSSTLPTFTQYVTCHTRDNKTLDLLYANTKEAYSSSPLPPLGGSDHNLVHLQPVYKPLVNREPVVKRTVRKWSAETEEALRVCFRSTVWDNLCSPLEDDLNIITDYITDYMNFCVDSTVPSIKEHFFDIRSNKGLSGVSILCNANPKPPPPSQKRVELKGGLT